MPERGRLRIATIVGARPQFVKAAVLSQELRRHPECEEYLIHTGQHYDFDMSKVFFQDLHMRDPDASLHVGSGSHGAQTGEMLRRLEPALTQARPDCVLVYGDTNSTLAGALAAAKMGLPVVHVEAGLRSFDRTMPEEINRIVVDHLASLLFAPHDEAVAQLAREGIRGGVFDVGDLMIDLVVETAAALPARPPVLERLALRSGTYALATVHRAANTDHASSFDRIVAGFRRVPLTVVFPVHPRTRALAQAAGIGRDGDNVVAIAPAPYAEMVALERHARVVLTDSGGVQKEAFALGVPCVTLRTNTEWTQTLHGGWNELAGDDPDIIARAAMRPRPDSPHGYTRAGKCAASIYRVLRAAFEKTGGAERTRATAAIGPVA